MTKPLTIALLTLLLASCDPPSAMGGQPSAWSLDGTSTAIAYVATSTAVSANATRAYADMVANANSTATAVQVTATAIAIGTAKAQITNAEAIAILEASQLEQEAARPGMTATALYLQNKSKYDAIQYQRRLDNDIARAAMRHKVITVFWIMIGLACLVGLYAAVTYINAYGKERRVRRERLRTRPEVIENENGQVLAITDEFKMVPPRQVTVIENHPAQPTPRPQSLYVDNANGHTSSRVGTLPPPDTNERMNINLWLIQVLQGMAFSRETAAQFKIGSDRADMILKTAVSQGYATKMGDYRTASIVPNTNFENFINQFIDNSPHPGAPVSNLPSPV